MEQGESRDGRRIGAQNAWTERQAQNLRQAKKRLAFRGVEAAFRADQNGEGEGPSGIGALAQHRHGIARWCVLVAENEETVLVPRVEQRIELDLRVRCPELSKSRIARRPRSHGRACDRH